MKILNAQELVGQILTHIDVSTEDNEILLTTTSGRQILINHLQDCCEEVSLVSVDGDWQKLLGRRLIAVDLEQSDEGEPLPESDDSYVLHDDTWTWTWTTLRFVIDEHTVITRWFGTSNGYYSESIEIKEIMAGA